MKRMTKYFCLLLLLIGSVQVNANEENLTELDAAFILAVKGNHFEKAQELIQAGANVNTPIPYTWTAGDCDWDIESTALVYAVRQNRPNLVKVLLKEEEKLNEALDLAIEEGFSNVVDELITGGADINFVDNNTNTPLINAIQRARATAEFCLQAQGKWTSRWDQRRLIIQTLLKAGADVNHVNKYGRTPLIEAVLEHDLNTVQTLLQAPGMNSSSINHADNNGDTALMLAIENVCWSYIDDQGYNICLNTQNIMAALVEAPGIDLFQTNKKGESALTLLEKLCKRMNI